MFKMSNETYDFLKVVVTKILPGIGTLYFALTKIWGLPYGTEIVGTIAAITFFLGSILGISTDEYNAELLIEEAKRSQAKEKKPAVKKKKKTPEITGE